WLERHERVGLHGPGGGLGRGGGHARARAAAVAAAPIATLVGQRGQREVGRGVVGFIAERVLARRRGAGSGGSRGWHGIGQLGALAGTLARRGGALALQDDTTERRRHVGRQRHHVAHFTLHDVGGAVVPVQ